MNPAVRKGLAIVGVALLLLIPLAWLHGLVSERTVLREQAIAAVARGWGGRQTLAGPILAIPVTTTFDDGKARTRDWYVLPESLDINAEVTVQQERRRLGVYEVPVYSSKVHITGQFDVPQELARFERTGETVNIHLDAARFLLPVTDPRGVREAPLLNGTLLQERLEPWRGFPIAVLAAPLAPNVNLRGGRQSFDLTLQIAGTQSFGVLPLAHASRVRMAGNWPSPGFASGFLPIERHVGERFDATWQVSDLNRSYGAHWMEDDIPENVLMDSALGVDLVQPVDLYQQSERAVKYAGVFIALSFLTLFIWEHLVRRPVHPIQYALMGLALSVFFLLLLALAEHIGFGVAYVLAALALCLLLGVYLAGAMRSAIAGTASSGAFGLLYALMYLLVTSDDYSLLAGALGLFAVLAVAMVLTRKVDWYQAGS